MEAYYADRTLPVPDLVEYVAQYGYARLLVHDWDEFPIEVPPSETELWREWGLGATFQEFYNINIAGLAGGFMKLAVQDPAFTASTIETQLHAKYARMAELANKPLEWFTPGEFTEEQRAEDEDSTDEARVRELFDLFEQLTCFSYAMPKLTTFSLTEESVKFGLPNRDLYNALEKIDLNQLYGELAQTEDKLRPVLRFLAQQKHLVNLDTAPEGFWWRHWRIGNGQSRPPRQR